MQIHIEGNNTREVLIIFGGFASHFTHFTPFFNGDFTRIVLYHYTHFDFTQLQRVLLDFKDCKITLIAFSMGVFVARLFLQNFSLKCRKIAVNGTEYGIHNTLGIPLKLFKHTLKYFNLDAFKKNLFGDFMDKTESFVFLDDVLLREELEFFIAHSLQYPITEYLQWDLVVIAKNDLIFNAIAQKRFWEGANAKEVLEIEAPHFAFFVWEFNAK